MQHQSFQINNQTRLGFWKLILADKEQATFFVRFLAESIRATINKPRTQDRDTTGRVTKKKRMDYTGVYFEFPVIDKERADSPAFFVLTPTDAFSNDSGDPSMFEEKFTASTNEIATFQSLAGDGILVCPYPDLARNCYSRHLAQFIFSAPEELVVNLFQTLAAQVVGFYEKTDRVYVSTSGLAVPWLHMRVYPAPKYYVWKDHDS